MSRTLHAQSDDLSFNRFLVQQQHYFPESDWNKIRHVLGYKFYAGIRKDTMALLTFMNRYPMVYMNYAGSLFSTMQKNQQLNIQNLALWQRWAQQNIDVESALSNIQMAKEISELLGDQVAKERFSQMEQTQQQKWR